MTICDVIKELGIPVSYYMFKSTEVEPPFVIYMGNGQDTFCADNDITFKNNQYQIQYYFKQKNEENETKLENILTKYGYIYDKSEDVYIDSEDLFVIYYYI